MRLVASGMSGVRLSRLLKTAACVLGAIAILHPLGCVLMFSQNQTETQNEPNDSFPYALGWVQLPPEMYNSIPLAALPSMGVLPSKVDLSNKMPPVGNQGNQGSCVSWAVGYALKGYQENVERAWGTGTPSHQFSPAYIHAQIKLTGTCPLAGAYISEALGILSSQGCCTLATMPYDENVCTQLPNDDARSEAVQYKISTWRKVNIQDLTELKIHLSSGFPIVVGMYVYSNFRPSKGTIYSQTGGTKRGGHAMCVVGYDDVTQTFKIMNSWGTDWGDDGCCRMAYAVFKQNTYEGYVAQDVISNLSYNLSLTALPSDGGRIQVGSSGPYPSGTVVVLTPLPNSEWAFDHWEGDLTGTVNPGSITMNANKAVTAVFEQNAAPKYTLTVNGGTGSGSYSAGQTVMISATVPSDKVFDKWTGDVDNVANVNAAATTITVNGNTTVAATFKDIPTAQYALIVNNGTGSGTYSAGQVVTITATTPSGKTFDKWTGSTANVTNVKAVSTTVTMKADTTVTATFVDVVYAGFSLTSKSVTSSVSPGGTVSGSISGSWWTEPGSEGALWYVVAGFRDNGSGAWVGGTPVGVASMQGLTLPLSPGSSFSARGFSNLAAPNAAGTYSVWIQMVPTTTLSGAISAFQSQTATTEGQYKKKVGDVTLH